MQLFINIRSLTKPKSVHLLDLSGNEIGTIDALLQTDIRLLQKLAYLTKLDLSENKLISFPGELFTVS